MNKNQKQKLKQVIDLLKVIGSSDDPEIKGAVISSVIEILEELNQE